MKKIILLLITVFIFISLLTAECSAVEVDEEYYLGLIESSIDSETAEKLEEIGIMNFTGDELFSVSFDSIGRYFSNDLHSKSDKVFSAFFRLLLALITLITFKTFICSDDGKSIGIIGTIAVTVLSVDICTEVLEVLLSAMKTGGNFLMSYIPVYTVILSLGGSVSTALTYNSVTFFFAQIISFVINSLAADLTGIFLSLSVAFSLNSTFNFNRFITTANKLVSTTIGFISGSFAAILSVRGVLSASIDSATSKSIKYLIGSLIPIVGTSISDAYSTVIGSINVIKGSVAVAGIIIMLVISLPPILEGVIYCATFAALSYLSEMGEFGSVTSVLRAFQSAIRTVVLLNVFQFFILVVSTAVLITVKGGG